MRHFITSNSHKYTLRKRRQYARINAIRVMRSGEKLHSPQAILFGPNTICNKYHWLAAIRLLVCILSQDMVEPYTREHSCEERKTLKRADNVNIMSDSDRGSA